jgi:formylglycine-generating enzyme required for sulfatase activity
MEVVLDMQRRTFLSYSRANKDFALKLARELKAEGLPVWLDQLDIPAGARWDREVEKALKESEVFMIILTPASTNSENVLDEIGYAIDNGKRILPVLLENCEVPLRLRRFQYVDFTSKSFDEGVQSAKELLEHIIAQLPSPPEGPANISSGQAVVTARNGLEAESASNRTASTAPPQGKFALQGVTLKLLGIAAVMIVIAGLAYSILSNRGKNNLLAPTSPPETAAILLPTSTLPAEVAITAPTPAPASTVTLAATPVPVLGIGSSMVSDKDGMVLWYVPASEFTMGSGESSSSNDAPAHQVTLDAFWIDETEVTIARYAKCVQAGACESPVYDPRNHYYAGDAQYDNYPVAFVNWSMASAYCTWAGRRLPTEAEWEKAARGANGSTYPWGDDAPSVIHLNFKPNGVGDAMPVGTYPDGASPCGALDMAGNVWEWVADYYARDYYTHSPSSNPQGPTDGTDSTARIVRGGSFDSNADGVKPSRRLLEEPGNTYRGVGFRCAQTP